MDCRQNVRGPKSTVNNALRTPNVLGSAQICDLPEFKRNYSTNTKFVKFNSLTSELLVFNLNDSFQCTSNVHEHSVFCGVVFLHPYFMSIAYR